MFASGEQMDFEKAACPVLVVTWVSLVLSLLCETPVALDLSCMESLDWRETSDVGWSRVSWHWATQ